MGAICCVVEEDTTFASILSSGSAAVNFFGVVTLLVISVLKNLSSIYVNEDLDL